MSSIDINSHSNKTIVEIQTEQVKNNVDLSSVDSMSNIEASSLNNSHLLDVDPSEHSLGKLSNVSVLADSPAKTVKILVKLEEALKWSVEELGDYIKTHNHTNLEILDKFSFSDSGKLLFDGVEIEGGSGAVHDHAEQLIRPAGFVFPKKPTSAILAKLKKNEFLFYGENTGNGGELPKGVGKLEDLSDVTTINLQNGEALVWDGVKWTNKTVGINDSDPRVAQWNTAYNIRHEHGNKSILDNITETLKKNWDDAYSWGNHAVAGYLKTADLSNNYYTKTVSDERFAKIAGDLTQDFSIKKLKYKTLVLATAAPTDLVAGEFGLWIGGDGNGTELPTPIGSLSDLSDVNIINITNRQSLIWDGSKWTNGEAGLNDSDPRVAQWNEAYNLRHSHSNKSLLDALTTTIRDNWNAAFNWGNHAVVGYLKGITSALVTTALGFTPISAAALSDYYTKPISDSRFASINGSLLQNFNSKKLNASTLLVPQIKPTDLVAGEFGLWLGDGVGGETPGAGGGLDAAALWIELSTNNASQKIHVSHLPVIPYSNISGTPTIPTVPAWALATTKPSYTWSEIAGKPTTFIYENDYRLINTRNPNSTPIESNMDLNNITTVGFHYCAANITTQTLKNCPTINAFGLIVTNSSGTYQRLTEYMIAGQRTWFRNYYPSSGWGAWILEYDENTGVPISNIKSLPNEWKILLSVPPIDKITRWPTFHEVTDKPTTLSGYGITDAATTSSLTDYLPKTGGTIFNDSNTVPLILDSSSDETILKILNKGSGKTAFGWITNPAIGSYMYNYTTAKYLGIRDDGVAYFNGNQLLDAGNFHLYSPSREEAIIVNPSNNLQPVDVQERYISASFGFGYNAYGFPADGSYLAFGGFGNCSYKTIIQADYINGNELFFWTKNEDSATVSPFRRVWHSGNSNLDWIDWTARTITANYGIVTGGLSANDTTPHIKLLNPYNTNVEWDIKSGWYGVSESYLTINNPKHNDHTDPVLAMSGAEIQLRRITTINDLLIVKKYGLTATIGAQNSSAFHFYTDASIALNNSLFTVGSHELGNSDYKWGNFHLSGWIYSYGDVGWYSSTYGGGIYMADSTYVRVYNGKSFRVDNEISAEIIEAAALVIPKSKPADMTAGKNYLWFEN